MLNIALSEQRDQLSGVQNDRQALAIELAQIKERFASVEKAAEAAQLAATEREQALQEQLVQQRHLEQMAREREAQAEGARAALEKQHLEDAEVCQNLRSELHAANEELANVKSSNAVQATQLEHSTQALKEAQEALKGAQAEVKVASREAAEASGREQSALAQIKALTEAEKLKAVK